MRRDGNGTPSRSNSSFSQPTPKVTVTRPPESQSMVDSALAVMIGCCVGSSTTQLLIRIVSVAPAKWAIAAIGVEVVRPREFDVFARNDVVLWHGNRRIAQLSRPI